MAFQLRQSEQTQDSDKMCAYHESLFTPELMLLIYQIPKSSYPLGKSTVETERSSSLQKSIKSVEYSQWFIRSHAY